MGTYGIWTFSLWTPESYIKKIHSHFCFVCGTCTSLCRHTRIKNRHLLRYDVHKVRATRGIIYILASFLGRDFGSGSFSSNGEVYTSDLKKKAQVLRIKNILRIECSYFLALNVQFGQKSVVALWCILLALLGSVLFAIAVGGQQRQRQRFGPLTHTVSQLPAWAVVYNY